MPWGVVAAAVPSLIGAAGSLAGGSKGAKQSLTGYNYLTDSKTGIGSQVQQGNQASTQQSDLLSGGANAKNAFGNYLNSTGYNFQLQQGTQAITGNQAARGLLGSGGTAKALTQFGQGLAGTAFQNYFSNLGSVANRGLTASGQIGQAGTTGGGNAGQITQSGLSSAGGQAGVAGGIAAGGVYNYFSPGAVAGPNGGQSNFSYQDPLNF